MTSHKVQITRAGKTVNVELVWDEVTDQVTVSCVTRVNGLKKPTTEWYWYSWEHETMRKIVKQ